MVAAKGLYNTMKTKNNIIPNEAVKTFEAVLINPNDAFHLHTGKNALGLLLERTTCANERIIEFCHGIIRGDRYKFRVILK
jgi:GntR family transcriptional regulator